MSNKKAFDVLVFGASGFTGRLVVEYLLKTYGLNKTVRWGVAGRSLSKLQNILSDITPKEQLLPEIVVCDADNEASLAEMATQTKVVLTTVGPYFKYGSKLVAACVQNGTHYCDLTGEAYWIRDMIDLHHAEAVKNKAKIVNCCGFDSIPSDLGTLMMVRALQNQQRSSTSQSSTPIQCSSVHYYVDSLAGGVSGGTLASIFTMLDCPLSVLLKRVKRLSNPYFLNPVEGVCNSEQPNKKGNDVPDQQGIWLEKLPTRGYRMTSAFIMAGINTRIVRRSNALLGHVYGEDFTYSEVISTPLRFSRILMALVMAVALKVFVLLAVLPGTNFVLQKLLPKPGEGPSAAARAAGHYRIELVAHGTGGVSELTMTGRVQGKQDPGYAETAVMIAETAVCLAKGEQEPGCLLGGVLTPASACGLPLIERLRARGMEFIVDEKGGEAAGNSNGKKNK